MTARSLAAAALVVTVASACGASSHAVPPARTTAKARVPVTFTMRWPSRAQAARRRPSFVSPSAASVVVEVNPDASPAGPVTFANAPAGGGSSTIPIDAPAGADAFIISIYDAPQTPGETTAAGNELGRVTVAQTIVANQTNTLSATVIGTVASIRIGPLANQANVLPIAGSSPAAYELVGRAPATFAVAPLDADGNAIVQPDAPPSISLGPNVRSTGVLSVTPVAGNAAQFTVQAVAPNTTTYPTALTANATDANGDVATSSTIVDVTSALYVAYANGGAPAVARFDPHGTQLPLPSGAFAWLANPVALAYDADDRAIFVADAGLGQVLAFDENGAPLGSFAPQSVAGVNGVAYDPNDRDVYASGANGVTVFAPTGAAPNGSVPATFTATSARGVAFIAANSNGPDDRLAVGRASASPGLAFFSESGAGRGSQPLSDTPLAVAYGAPLQTGQSPQT
ncbi:MAG TPA: hypothetical protein VHT53_11890, partial [Candidatus Elarobacter sp.]|nr:hypothetical protein [Candidatus Elarobacter sp.]